MAYLENGTYVNREMDEMNGVDPLTIERKELLEKEYIAEDAKTKFNRAEEEDEKPDWPVMPSSGGVWTGPRGVLLGCAWIFLATFCMKVIVHNLILGLSIPAIGIILTIIAEHVIVNGKNSYQKTRKAIKTLRNNIKTARFKAKERMGNRNFWLKNRNHE